MTRALICTGVLSGGTAIVFALALAVSLAFPQGSLVPVGWNGGWARPGFADDVVIGRSAPWPGMDRLDAVVVEAPPEMGVPAVPAPAPVEAES